MSEDRLAIAQVVQDWTRLGFQVKPDMPQLRGPEVERLYSQGRAWLEGANIGAT